MQRKQLVYLLAILALLVSMLPLSAAAQEAPPAPLRIEELAAPDNKAGDGSGATGSALSLSPDGMAFFNETEPNDTTATANALPGSQVAVYGAISPATEVDFFSFTANAGDRVYAATQTQWSNGGSTDTVLDIYASNGTTVLETDDESGSFSGSSSAIGGTIIPAAGTYYIRVDGFSTTSTITPYFLHVRVQSGAPTAEVEPNNSPATATPLAASGWMSGTITATSTAGEADFFSFTLNAGDSVFLGLDMDPGRLPSNTNWNGRLGMGIFAGNQILVANDGSTTKPHAEAFFMTVQQAGTYYAYVDSTSATGLGANARYNLSVSIYPKQVQNNCTTFTSTNVPVTIGPGAGTATSTIVVPPTVTSSIQDINATIVLTHSIMADLDVTLLGPTAVSVPLFTDVGSTATGGQTQMNLGLDDQAALPIGPFTVVAGMVNQPEQPGRLAGFNGTPAAGTWTLQLADDTTNTSGGRLLSWSLEVCGDPPPAYAIDLNKTVGTVPAVCATTDSITVPPGGFDVYYCYTVRNTGLNTLNVHDLVDSELGVIFTGVNYALAPGATYSHIQQATIYDTVTNTGTWTAYNLPDGGPTASDSDTATVNVRAMACPVGYQPVAVDASFFDNPFPPAGWSVTNTTTGCNAAGAVPQWTNTNPGNRANLTGGVGPFAIADSDKCGSGSSLNSIMSTGMLDFTGMISPTVSFNTDYDDFGAGDDRAILASSTDGGATWAPLFTWDGDHRGPLLVTQALPGAGENDVMVRWDYASTWDWWWEVDNAFLTACEPIPANPAISLDKTVGTDDSVCATTDEITLPYGGGEVTYCYEVTNTGDVTLNRHDLDDSELGALLTNFPYSLAPGASVFITATTNIGVTTVNTATWTAYNPADGFVSVWATDAATVTVEGPAPAITLAKTVGTDPMVCATGDAITVPANTDVTYCYTVTNTGNVTLNSHDLTDSQLGALLTNFYYELAPGASVFVTETTNIAVTTVNTATWYAELIPAEGGNPSAWATDTATVTVQSAGPAIDLVKTVGTVPGVCAATDSIVVTAGTEVYYCYQVENTGDVTFNFHDLVDSELGTILNDLPYTLAPGAFSPQVIVADTPMASVTNVGTWTALTALGTYAYDDTVPFNYIPINTTGTPLGLADDGEANITSPFPFTFYGVTSTNLRVGNNGGILFNATTGDVPITNAALPVATPALSILPFWDDIDADTGDVYWEVQGTAPNRMLIVEWYNRPHYSNIGSATFQVILYETSNEIKYQYLDTDFGDPTYNFGASATAGINKDASAALQYSFNQPVLTNNKAIRFYEVVPVSASDTDSATVTVQTPNIDVTPLSLSETHLTPPQSTTQPLTVANTGLGTLTWAIAEEPTAVQPAPLSGGDAAVAADVVDPSDFKAPEQTAAPAPLSDWRAPDAVLYDNGGLITNPTGGAGGAALSALQTALGLGTYGFGNQVSAGNRVADDFTVTGSGWLINTITFFGYQTGSTTTSTFTSLNLRIWDGPPNDPASMVVFGDTTTNRLASSTWSNIYRALDTTPTDSTRPIMANVATVNTFLPAGTYWLDWQAGGTLASGPWAPPVTILGQTGKPGANALQFTTTGWAAVTDPSPGGTPQDLPFIVDGLADCANISDVPWLSVSPTNGANTGGTNTPVTVTFNSASLASGIYTANLCVTSNDPDLGPGNGTGLVIVPVTLQVGESTAVTLSDISAAPLPPAGLPLAALPAVLGLALSAAYVLRRKE